MRVNVLPLLGALFASLPCAPAVLAQTTAITDCRSAAQAFEQTAKLPAGLLLAIGQVESGRRDAATGRVDPWPWATNHAGEGHYFASAQEAIAWVAAQQAYGIRSIDVGCFQVNLQYHPNAFASLAEAFDPAANARYAAQFLNELHERSGNWPAAIALYHSGDPFEGQRSSSRVSAAWSSGGLFTSGPPVVASTRSFDPFVMRLSAAASLVRIELPGTSTVRPSAPLLAQRNFLPRVFTPSR